MAVQFSNFPLHSLNISISVISVIYVVICSSNLEYKTVVTAIGHAYLDQFPMSPFLSFPLYYMHQTINQGSAGECNRLSASKPRDRLDINKAQGPGFRQRIDFGAVQNLKSTSCRSVFTGVKIPCTVANCRGQ